MADDNLGPSVRPSWHEREIAQSLQRLASARAHLAQLEEQVSDGARIERDPADLARVEEMQTDIERLITKASGRFGGSGARAKLEDAQRQQQAVLERLGVTTYAELQEASAAGAEPAVDPTVLDFARRECAEAEKEFLEVAAMVIPEADDDQDDADEDAEVIAAADAFEDGTELDLRIEPSAAS